MSDQRDATSITPDSLPPRARRRRPILANVTLALVGLVMVARVVVFFVLRNNPFDRSLGTYAIMGGVFLSAMTLWAWFVLFSQFSGKFRVRVNLFLIVVVVTTVAIFRIDGFDGRMRPIVNWRWARQAGELVSEVEVASNISFGIDLTTTTPDDFPQFLGPERNQNLPGPNLDHDWDMEAADFRAGLPLTFGCGNWQTKVAYYHLSSHLGDEFAIRNPGSLASRINYSRDALVLGVSYYATPAARFSRRPRASSPTSTPRAIRTSGSTADAKSSTSWSSSPSTGRRSCSAPSTPTSSRTRAHRRT